MTVAGLLLAAGSGTRYGGPKGLVELDGELLVQRAARLLDDGGCDPVVVVVGAAGAQVAAQVPGLRTVHAPGWEEGMGASLRAGLDALAGSPACVVALVDQPLVGPGSVRRLVAAWGSGAVAAVASYDGEPRNPVLLDASVWPEVAAAAVGDLGARAWLRRHPDRVVDVPCDGTGSAVDVDTPADLAALRA